MINAAMEAEGQEREDLFREAARYMHEEVLADILITHRVDYARISPRLEFDVDGRNVGNFFLEEMSLNEG